MRIDIPRALPIIRHVAPHMTMWLSGIGVLILGLVTVQPGYGQTKAPASVPVIEITPAGGPLLEQLKDQADSAAAHGQLALLDIGATWCGPCLAFQRTLSTPIMVQSLKGVRLVHLDFDTWHGELMKHGYIGTYDLPELLLLTRTGGMRKRFHKEQWSDYADSVHTKTIADAYGPPLQAWITAERNAKTPAD